MRVQNFAKLFDHSIVCPYATRDEVLRFAETAVELGTATLTVQPCYIQFAAGFLKGSGVLLGSVVGFPHGNETPDMKEYQAKSMLDMGVEEIDMVMNIPALKNGEKNLFIEDISGIVEMAGEVLVKVITENCYLTQEEKRKACQWIAETGADYVKTSTAYAEGGATVDDVRLMYEAVQGKCLVKAAGGIREIDDIIEYLKAGARRFGSSRTEQFVQAYRELPHEQKSAFRNFLVDLKSG